MGEACANPHEGSVWFLRLNADGMQLVHVASKDQSNAQQCDVAAQLGELLDAVVFEAIDGPTEIGKVPSQS